MTMSENMSHNAKIIVEGNIKVLYKGVWVSEIKFDQEEIHIGVMDPEHDIYPDINLRQYRLDGGDPYISRRHAKFLCKDGLYFIQDICNNNSTSIGTKTNVVNNETIQLNHGDRVFFSESLAFRFEITSDDAVEESKEEVTNEENSHSEYYLEIESKTSLFFKLRNTFTHTIDLNPESWNVTEDGIPFLSIGRRSTEDGIYPDVDLWKFYFNESDEYIARKHACITFDNGSFYFQDISGKGSTWLNVRDDEHRLLKNQNNDGKKELMVGDRLIISDSCELILKKYEEQNTTDE